MDLEKDANDSRKPRDRIVPERGTVSGRGSGLPDEEALAILRMAEPKPGSQEPDIEVVVSPSVSHYQTKIASPYFRERGTAIWREQADLTYLYSHHETPAPEPDLGKVIVNVDSLNSTVRSVLDRGHVLPHAEDALGQGEPLRMRLSVGKSTIDLDLADDQLAGLDLTLNELIARAVR